MQPLNLKHFLCYLLLAATVVLMLARCGKGDETVEPPATSYLTVTQSLPETPFTAEGGSATIVFSTDERWEITLEPSEAEQKMREIAASLRNAADADRTTQNSASNAGFATKNSAAAALVSASSLGADRTLPSATKQTAPSATNQTATLSPDQWCDITPLSGDAGTDISVTITVDPNEENIRRGFTLVLRSETLEERIEVGKHDKNDPLRTD